MKSLKSGFLALALVAGLTGAFASNVHAAAKTLDAVFDWQQVTATGILVVGGQFDPGVSKAQAKLDFSCDDTKTDFCARTVDQQDGDITSDGTIKKSN